MSTVHVGKDAVGDGEQSSFGGMPGSETMLGWGQEMIAGHVIEQLALHHTLHNLGHDGNYGYGAVVGSHGRITGFEDWVDQGMFPGFREVT